MMKNGYLGNGGFLLFYSDLCIPWTCSYINTLRIIIVYYMLENGAV